MFIPASVPTWGRHCVSFLLSWLLRCWTSQYAGFSRSWQCGKLWPGCGRSPSFPPLSEARSQHSQWQEVKRMEKTSGFLLVFFECQVLIVGFSVSILYIFWARTVWRIRDLQTFPRIPFLLPGAHRVSPRHPPPSLFALSVLLVSRSRSQRRSCARTLPASCSDRGLWSTLRTATRGVKAQLHMRARGIRSKRHLLNPGFKSVGPSIRYQKRPP